MLFNNVNIAFFMIKIIAYYTCGCKQGMIISCKTMKKHYYKGIILTISFLAILSGCTKKANEDTPITTEVSSFSLMQDKILTPTCATSGCHASTADGSFKQHGLVLEKSVAYENLVGITPFNALSKADGHLRVKAYKSLESLLFPLNSHRLPIFPRPNHAV